MEKIPTLFERDFTANNGRYVIVGNVTPGCEWVFNGEGVATRKYDGTCVMLRDGKWWARREVKAGKQPPGIFLPISTDPETGKTVGWEPIEQSGFAKWHDEALATADDEFKEGTYELCGPKVNGNPEGYDKHVLIHHGDAEQLQAAGERTSNDVVATVLAHGWEGIVWHHPDGRMAKLKRRDIPSSLPVVAS